MNTCLQSISTTIGKDKMTIMFPFQFSWQKSEFSQKDIQLELTNVVFVNYETNFSLFLTCFINTWWQLPFYINERSIC